MNRNSENDEPEELAISLSLPASDAALFSRKATNPTLTFLARHPYQEYSISDLANRLAFSASMIVRAINPLITNDLVIESKDGNKRTVQINRERLSIPEDSYLQIQQTAFQEPVREAAQRLVDELESVLAIVLYGSVARGEADRKSDIDLWVLVDKDRDTNQQRAQFLKKDLGEKAFDGDRYAFHIDVESVDSVPAYTENIQQILAEGIVLERESDFRYVENFLNQEMDEENSND